MIEGEMQIHTHAAMFMASFTAVMREKQSKGLGTEKPNVSSMKCLGLKKEGLSDTCSNMGEPRIHLLMTLASHKIADTV